MPEVNHLMLLIVPVGATVALRRIVTQKLRFVPADGIGTGSAAPGMGASEEEYLVEPAATLVVSGVDPVKRWS